MEQKNSNTRILLVDDNPKNLQILISYLKNHHYQISIATNGSDALEQVAVVRPHLILLDIMMPGMDGFEVCVSLKSNPETESIPVIFITAMAENEHKLKGFELGGVDYITKPFHKLEVMARIETQLTMIRQKEDLLALNSELLTSNKMLEEANDSKEKLLTVIGHDLRGPIGNINNLLHLIRDNQLDASDRDDLLDETIKSVQNAYFMLENLLFWAKSQRDEIEFYSEEIDLAAHIDDTIEPLIPLAADKDIIITTNIDSNVAVLGDSNMLTIVIRNLISNAIKFTPRGGNIAIRSSVVNPETVRIEVKDTGVGLTADQIAGLYKPGLHKSERGTQNEKGTGVGLSLCSEFLEHHGSVLNIESVPGKGSEFSFTLKLFLHHQ